MEILKTLKHSCSFLLTFICFDTHSTRILFFIHLMKYWLWSHTKNIMLPSKHPAATKKLWLIFNAIKMGKLSANSICNYIFYHFRLKSNTMPFWEMRIFSEIQLNFQNAGNARIKYPSKVQNISVKIYNLKFHSVRWKIMFSHSTIDKFKEKILFIYFAFVIGAFWPKKAWKLMMTPISEIFAINLTIYWFF